MMEHLIEHVAYHDAQKALKECYRVLKPGGVLRIGTPDLKKYVALYSNHEQPQNREASDFIIDNWVRQSFYTAREYGGPETPREPLFVLNDIFMNYEHRFIYDEDCLSRELAKAGFSDVCRVESLKSSHDALRGIDNHADPIYAYLTVTLEATKRTS
jgi:ubiquinone/menaquinone biosynthesis C-methylase UbiE